MGLWWFVFYGQVSLSTAEVSASHDTSRIVAVGGTVTEIVYALGAGERLVGVDTSRTYPEGGYQTLASGVSARPVGGRDTLAATEHGVGDD